MKILVTGGCGFIGSNYVLRQVLRCGNIVLNLDKLTYAGNITNLSEIANNNNYSFINGDICDIECVTSAINSFKPNVIVHFAAESHVDRSIKNPTDFIKTNILGTGTLLNAAQSFYNKKKNDFLFIHISTDEVFGSLGSKGFFIEESPYKPNSPYSATKAGSDHLVRAWIKSYGLPAIITNCSNNYGPFQNPEKLIPLIITNCVGEKQLPIYGNGKNIRDWLFVEDHCEAIDTVIEHGQIGETYNIGANNEKTNVEIVRTICSLLDEIKPRNNGESYEKLITFVEDRPGHDFRYAINSSKINSELRWSPKEKFSTAIRKTIQWYLDNENWWKKFKKKI